MTETNYRLYFDYRGYAVHYSDNQDVWKCDALDIEAERIPTIKTKIDKVIAASRKIKDTPALYVDYRGEGKDITVIAIAQGKATKNNPNAEPTDAWCLVPDSEWYFDHDLKKQAKRPVMTRQKLSLGSVMKDTPENRAIVAEMERMQTESDRLLRERAALRNKLVPMILTDLKITDHAEED